MVRSDSYSISCTCAEERDKSLDKNAGSDSGESLDDLLAALFTFKGRPNLQHVPEAEERITDLLSCLDQSKRCAHHYFVSLWFEVLARWAESNSDIAQYLDNYDKFTVASLPWELLLLLEGARPACMSEWPTRVPLSHVLAVANRILEMTCGEQRKRIDGRPVACPNGDKYVLWENGLRITRFFFYLHSSETEQAVQKLSAHACSLCAPGEFMFAGNHTDIGEILGYILPWNRVGASRHSLGFELCVYPYGDPVNCNTKPAMYTYAEALDKEQIIATNAKHGDQVVERKLAERMHAFKQVFQRDVKLDMLVEWTCCIHSLGDDVDPREEAALEQ